MDDWIVLLGFVVALLLIYPETQPEARICRPEERTYKICIEEFDPVCGKDVFGRELGTYPNPCEVCQNPDVYYYMKGECD